MRNSPSKIVLLRAAIANKTLQAPEYSVRVSLGPPSVDASLKGGLQRGALHEIFADCGHEMAATGFVAALCLRIAASQHFLWIRQDFSAREYGELSGAGFLALGLNPACLLLLRATDAAQALCAAADALSCSAFGAVVIEIPGAPKILDLVASRRLALGAAQKNVTALLLRFAAEPQPSATETRWLIRAARSPVEEENWDQPVFETRLVRDRRGRTGQWVMEWNCEANLFREIYNKDAANLGALVPAPSNRPSSAAVESHGSTRGFQPVT